MEQVEEEARTWGEIFHFLASASERAIIMGPILAPGTLGHRLPRATTDGTDAGFFYAAHRTLWPR
ncbi:hypothetical protein ZHAS_00015804 [Anopheles sinensis]|uniref:Uncharacterized protein n=1 Tax=Anopheles sinensis TaxID=74873 RepID=A0A084WBZ3_ANOSI|nr:hypothetical protein ZHAS_00015804 [Anopheles sinensis]